MSVDPTNCFGTCSECVSEKRVGVIGAYKRIEKAARGGRGVHLSRFEVAMIWAMDDALRQAVQGALEDAELAEKP